MPDFADTLVCGAIVFLTRRACSSRTISTTERSTLSGRALPTHQSHRRISRPTMKTDGPAPTELPSTCRQMLENLRSNR
jgi:hypothetical protein